MQLSTTRPLACLIVVGLSAVLVRPGTEDSRAPVVQPSSTVAAATRQSGATITYDYKSLNRLANSGLPLVQGVVVSAEEHRLRGKTNAPPDGHEYDYTFVAYTFRIERLWPTATSPFELPLYEGMVVNGAEGPGTLGRWTGRTPAPAPTQVGDRLLGFVGRNFLEIENEIARRPDPKVPVISFSGSAAIWLLEDRPDADNGKVRTYATNMFDTRSGPLEDVLARIDYERSLGFRPDRFSREVGG